MPIHYDPLYIVFWDNPMGSCHADVTHLRYFSFHSAVTVLPLFSFLLMNVNYIFATAVKSLICSKERGAGAVH